MLPKEVLENVRRLEIGTKGLVNEIFSGEYHTVFKGRGMEFAEVREYVPGDDIRLIDWNVSARTGSPFIKVFSEERELSMMLVVDMSRSGTFGTSYRMKDEVAIEICALLAFSAMKNNDKVGLLIFTDRVEKFIPPRKGRQHVLRVLREIVYHEPENKGTNMSSALEYLLRVIRRNSVVFILSDFMDDGFQKSLRVVSSKHDVIAIKVTDKLEIQLPDAGLISLVDAETGENVVVDTSDEKIRNSYSALRQAQQEGLEKMFKKINLDYINIKTGESYVEPLYKFFRKRAKRFH
ncbi:MAG: DUF58 domain-containing protein [Candidatus Marinimicrobia bacterium]|nr:DUF58 domain-containing protein [Candidatus Neomarinimicrobiota bacterium]TFB10320.1 DUF58 domain-containing protein [Candidatus Marinimicrobia bacterium MT.SAG.2]